MATYTSHYNLTKPEGTERVNIGIINQNMDTIDAQMYKNAQSIIANHGGMAIASNNNTHAAVSSGQYVYVYNHSSLDEGVYVATSAISTNGALSLSNLEAVPNGGLNHVYSTLNSKMTQNDLGTLSSLPDITICRNGLISFALSAQIAIQDVYLPAGTRFIGCNYSNIAHFAVMPNNNNFYVVRYSSDNGWIVLKRL